MCTLKKYYQSDQITVLGIGAKCRLHGEDKKRIKMLSSKTLKYQFTREAYTRRMAVYERIFMKYIL
jgi:hypothetical protein